MAKVMCRCGNLLSSVQCPNDVQLRVYTDAEWDAIINMGVIDSVDIPFPKYDVWKCPKCGRIYVYDDGYGDPIAVYTLEK